jgi:hypothetical protein
VKWLMVQGRRRAQSLMGKMGKAPGAESPGPSYPWGKGCLPLRTHEVIASGKDGSRMLRRDSAEAAGAFTTRTLSTSPSGVCVMQ